MADLGVPAPNDKMSLDSRIRKEVSKPIKKQPAPALSEPIRRSTGCRIHTPAGSCPVKPESYGKQEWKERQFDEELIRSWSLAVYEAGQKSGLDYSANAIVYFARSFWEISNPAFSRVREIIQGCIR